MRKQPALVAINSELEDLWGEDYRYYQFGGPDWQKLASCWLPAPPSELPELADRSNIAPLEAVKVHITEQANVHRHLHYVSFGITDLYGEELEDERPEDERWNQLGFEMTLRLPYADDEEIYFWPASIMADYAGYILNSQRTFLEGHYIDNGGPVFPTAPTTIHGFAFVQDPELGIIDSCRGKIEMLQLVALTRDELDLCKEQKTSAYLLDVMEDENPLFLSYMQRESILSDPSVKEKILKGFAQVNS